MTITKNSDIITIKEVDINCGKIEDAYISKETLLEDYEIVDMEGILRNTFR